MTAKRPLFETPKPDTGNIGEGTAGETRPLAMSGLASLAVLELKAATATEGLREAMAKEPQPDGSSMRGFEKLRRTSPAMVPTVM